MPSEPLSLSEREEIRVEVEQVESGAHVTNRMKARDSPMTSSIELARGTHEITAKISHEAIYQAVCGHAKRGLRTGSHIKLHRRRRCCKHRFPNGETPLSQRQLRCHHRLTRIIVPRTDM